MLFSRGQKISPNNYDAVIIGSGLSGMTCANVLAKGGRKVLLLEAHNKLGGFATWFFRADKKIIFDVSLHGFPAGMIKTCKRYWSKEIANLIVQLKDIRFVNPQFELKTDYTKVDFKKILIEKFNIQPSTVDEFFQFIEGMNFYDNSQMTNGELFEKFFPGRNDVIRLLMEPITYANGSTLTDPALTYGIVFSNFMGSGVYTFEGGTDHLIKMMRDELLNNGVDIKLNAKVKKIHIEGNRVTGVATEDDHINTSVIVSNANLYKTIFELTGEQYFETSFLSKAKSVRMNSSSCQVYMSFKKDFKLPHIGDLIFTSKDPNYDAKKLLSHHTTSRTFSVYYPETRPEQNMPTTVVASTNANYQDWKNLSEQDYEFHKNKLIEDTIKAFDEIVPDASKYIEHIEAATPLTIERYTHHQHGASFGTKFEGLEVSTKLHEQISGLYHSGSVGIIMSGWLGAANYGVIQSNQVESYLLKQEHHNLAQEGNI
jgi:phytoene dehydrogenase-like protein